MKPPCELNNIVFLFYFTNSGVRAHLTSKMFLAPPPPPLAFCCLFYGDDSDAVDSFVLLLPMCVRVCVCGTSWSNSLFILYADTQ